MTASDRHGGLADVLDDHLTAEFATRDVDATMAIMTDDPYLNHVPVLTGGIGREEVRRFHELIFIGHWQADTTIERISRTVTSKISQAASCIATQPDGRALHDRCRPERRRVTGRTRASRWIGIWSRRCLRHQASG